MQNNLFRGMTGSLVSAPVFDAARQNHQFSVRSLMDAIDVTPVKEVDIIANEVVLPEGRLPFIESNTKEVSMDHLKQDCIIPVFSKDNEITISHQSFIDTVRKAAGDAFSHETVTGPSVRVSHVVKGRIPEAMHKPVSQLLESDKTIYYERMMFCVEIPIVHRDIDGSRLNLTIGGVRAYNQENLYTRKSPEKFKIFIGFKNLVCCNMCVSTDGYMSSLRVMDTESLYEAAYELFSRYDHEKHLSMMEAMTDVTMTEQQFAQFLGRSRMYQYLPASMKRELPQMLMTDTQIGLVAKAYYEDEHFSGTGDPISLWNVYNLLTGANKSSYIDMFLDRSQNAMEIAMGLSRAVLGDDGFSWFIR